MPTMASGTSAMIAFAAGDRDRRAQRDFQHPHAAGDQRPGERDRVLKPFDGQHRDDDGLFEQRGEFFLFCHHREALREDAAPGKVFAGIAERGMMAPGWHTTTPARRCPARAASTGSAPASRAAI